jgi:hypothetical protein
MSACVMMSVNAVSSTDQRNSRELRRNGPVSRYRAAAADKLAKKQALRPKPWKLAMHGQLRQAVVRKP